MCRGQEPQLRQSADVERQTQECVIVQFEVHEFSELAELSRELLQAILAEVQVLEGPLEGGQTECLTEGFQVVIVEDEFGKTAEVTDGGGKFLDMVVTEV